MLMVSGSREEIQSLTWLRGLAALVVVVSHSVRALEVRYHPGDELSGFGLLNTLDLGSLGVALFFVLSGCTLTLSNDRLKTSSGPALASFYSKRFFRIWPAYVIALLAYLAFRPLFQMLYGEPQGHWVEAQFFKPAGLTDLLQYLGLIFNLTGTSGLYNNAFWSLPVEFQYYLLFPLFLASMRQASALGPLAIAAGMFFLARSGILPLNSSLVLVLAFTFAAGMVLGHLYTRSAFRLNVHFSIAGIAAITALASLMANDIVRIEVYRIIPSEWVFYGLCGVALAGLTLFGNVRLPHPFLTPALYLGKVSYSLYLYHNLIIAFAILGLMHFGIHGEWARTLWVCALAFGGSIAVAAASYHWIEAPGIRLGRRIGHLRQFPVATNHAK